MMKFEITIQGDTQPDLIYCLEQCIKRLKEGGCFINSWGSGYDIVMSPANGYTEIHMHQLFEKSHTKPTVEWVD